MTFLVTFYIYMWRCAIVDRSHVSSLARHGANCLQLFGCRVVGPVCWPGVPARLSCKIRWPGLLARFVGPVRWPGSQLSGLLRLTLFGCRLKFVLALSSLLQVVEHAIFVSGLPPPLWSLLLLLHIGIWGYSNLSKHFVSQSHPDRPHTRAIPHQNDHCCS